MQHYDRYMESTTTQSIRSFLLINHLLDQKEMGSDEVNAFLSHLATNEQVSASTQNPALAAVLFQIRELLG